VRVTIQLHDDKDLIYAFVGEIQNQEQLPDLLASQLLRNGQGIKEAWDNWNSEGWQRVRAERIKSS